MSISQTLNYPWDVVISLLWNKYPNPFAKHVIKEDIIERSLDRDGRLYTKRLVLKNYMGSLPCWVRSHLKSTHEYVIEESIVDMNERVLTTHTRNIGSASKHAVLVENVEYKPDEHKCVLYRKAHVESKLNWSARYPLTMFLLHRYKHTAKQSFRGLEYICNDAMGTDNYVTSLKDRIQQKARSARGYASAKRPQVVIAQSNDE